MLTQRCRMFAVLAVVWLVKAPFYLIFGPIFLFAMLLHAAIELWFDLLEQAEWYTAALRRRRRWAAIRRKAAANNKESNA